MRQTIGLAIAAIIICSIAGGCGTLVNLPEAEYPGMLKPDVTRLPYGGVRMDAAIGSDCLLSPPYGVPVGAYILFVDLPLSAIGDTLTLPYVLYMGPSKRPSFQTYEPPQGWKDVAKPETDSLEKLPPPPELPLIEKPQ